MWGEIILIMFVGFVLGIINYQQQEAQKIEFNKRPGVKLMKIYIYIFLISLFFIAIYSFFIK